MASPIKRLEKGRQPTLLDTDKANELIDLLNALVNVQISPAGAGRLNIGKDSAILDLSPLMADTSSTDDPNNVNSSGVSISSLAIQVALLTDVLSHVLFSLNNIIADAVCNDDGTITFTLTLPDLPPESALPVQF